MNLFRNLPDHVPLELIESLLQAGHLRIERIVSHGHSSPAGFWYDQAQNEWVVLLQGAAMLQFEEVKIEMQPGDFVNIPAHKKHRVEWTSAEESTIWLAVHYG